MSSAEKADIGAVVCFWLGIIEGYQSKDALACPTTGAPSNKPGGGRLFSGSRSHTTGECFKVRSAAFIVQSHARYFRSFSAVEVIIGAMVRAALFQKWKLNSEL